MNFEVRFLNPETRYKKTACSPAGKQTVHNLNQINLPNISVEAHHACSMPEAFHKLLRQLPSRQHRVRVW
jgi:hypothetical protein